MNRRKWLRCLAVMIAVFQAVNVVLVQAENLTDRFDAKEFDETVAPLLVRRCVECHQGTDPSGGLSLISRNGLLKGGDSGVVIDPESPADSYLLQRVSDGEMPPEKQGQAQKLAKEEIAVLRRWVHAGAPWPDQRKLDFFERTTDVRAGRDWWSLQQLVRPPIPQLKNGPQPASPIDAYVRFRLEQTGMAPASKADPAVRLRRLHHVLTGLPPSLAQIEAFVADPSNQAWEGAIDCLLDSPQYGVRWARHWLDLARYADTSGYERDQEKPFAWKYRDWVVDALNSDMPYDRFILHQLAGDEVEDRSESSVIATGFLRLGTWNDEPNDPADYVYDRLEDLVHTTSTAFLGMTVKCARCHSHKFDPITQEDYYRMGSVFWAGPVDRGSDLGGPKAEELGFGEVLGWTDVSAEAGPLHLLKNGERHKQLHEVLPATLSMLPALDRPLDPPDEGAKTTGRRLQYAKWIADKNNPLTSRVLVNRLWQHQFGKAIVRSPNNFGFLADPPTHPQLLDWLAAEFVQGGWHIKRMHKLILMSETWQQSSVHESEEQYVGVDSGNRRWWRAERRRLDAETLRDCMLDASGELDLRLGGVGFRPTISEEALEGLSRKSAAWNASPPEEQLRRSLYTYVKRGLLPPMMTTFDLCDTTQPCGQRDSTTVPTQSLTLLNNPFVHQRSRAIANALYDASLPPDSQIQSMWASVLRRRATPRELSLAKNHLSSQRKLIEQEKADADRLGKESDLSERYGIDLAESRPALNPEVLSLASLAHVLLNSNEFLYVD